MLASILTSNRIHCDRAVEKVLSTGKRRVGMIGLSFKAGTDDLRESPLVTIAEQFIGKGLSLLVYDPEVSLSRLLGANRRFIEHHIPHIGALLCADLQQVVEQSDVLVVGLGDKRVLNEVQRFAQPGQFILDLVGSPELSACAGTVEGLCW